MMKKIALILCFSLLALAAQAETLVSLRASAEVRGQAIRLSDVFDGISKEQDRDIALAPEPGKSVTYNAAVLTQLAQEHRLIWKPQGLTDCAILTRASVEITDSMIREKILSRLKETEGKVTDSSEILFDTRRVSFYLPAEQGPSFDLGAFSYDSQNRRFQTEIVAQSGTTPLRFALTGRVNIRREVPVLAQRLQARTVITNNDLVWEIVDENRLPRDAVTDRAQIVGMELRNDTGESTVLRMRDLLPPRLVLRGGLVTIKIDTPLMQITARGRAAEDGAKGDVVHVTNLQSKRTIEAVVEADGVVRVELTRKVAQAQ